MKVFDISYWQPLDTVPKIKDMGADGVILRLGYTYKGIPCLDEKVAHFYSEACNYNLPVGFYYYSTMRSDTEGKNEASFINDKVYDLLHGNNPPLGVWLDMEDGLTKYPGIDKITYFTRDLLSSWYFDTVGIYASYSYFKDYFSMYNLRDQQIPIWVANYDRKNWLKEEYPDLNWYGWQFSENYEYQNLDCSVWYKDPRME